MPYLMSSWPQVVHLVHLKKMQHNIGNSFDIKFIKEIQIMKGPLKGQYPLQIRHIGLKCEPLFFVKVIWELKIRIL